MTGLGDARPHPRRVPARARFLVLPADQCTLATIPCQWVGYLSTCFPNPAILLTHADRRQHVSHLAFKDDARDRDRRCRTSAQAAVILPRPLVRRVEVSERELVPMARGLGLDMADIGTAIDRRPTTEPPVWWAIP